MVRCNNRVDPLAAHPTHRQKVCVGVLHTEVEAVVVHHGSTQVNLKTEPKITNMPNLFAGVPVHPVGT